jgi:hypothetical protein
MSAHTGQPGKTDASRSSVAACSAAPAAHGRSGPLACSGSAGLLPAGPHAGPDPGTPRCSTAGRGRSGCTPGPAPGSRRRAHRYVRPVRAAPAAAPLDPAAGQPTLRLPLQSPQRLLRSLCRSGGRTPSAGAILLVHCVQHGGVRWHKQLPRRSAAAPVSIAQASIVLPLSGLLAQDPPAQTPPPTARNARPSCSSTTAAGLSTAAGGRRIRRTNDRRGGQVVFAATTSRQAAQRPTAAYSVTKIPPGNGSASVSETRVNFRERQSRA